MDMMAEIRREFGLETVNVRTYSPWCWPISETGFTSL